MSGWRLRSGYSYLDIRLDPRPGSTDLQSRAPEGSSPRHQTFLVSQWDLPHGITVDALGRFVDGLGSQGVPSYAALDVRLAWQINRSWEVSVTGQNLTEARHAEFVGSSLNGSVAGEIPRSVLGRVTWRY